jgi:hypothetical protein
MDRSEPVASSASGHTERRLGAGVWRVPSGRPTTAAVAALTAGGWSVRRVALPRVGDRRAVIDAFATALGFPGWVGQNWDALEDALRDLSWWVSGARGRAVVVTGWASFGRREAVDAAVLGEVLRSAASSFGETDEPLAIVLRG